MTQVWDDMSSMEERVPRDRWGRPMIVPADGGKPKAYTRVTTFAGSVEDMYGLGQWQQRMVALGLAKRSDLLLSVSAHAEDKDELNRIVDQAREAAAASAAATTGTALHKLAERYDRGELALADMPESNRADVAAYAAAMAPFAIHGIEQFVVIDELQVAGTFDRIVEHGGQRYVADIKTGSIEYGVGKMAVQLALYSRGALYETGKAERSQTGVSSTAGIIIHLPAGQGRCDLHWINLTAGWEAARLCEQVRAWRKRKGLLAAASFGSVVLEKPEPAQRRVASAIIDSLLSAADDLDPVEFEAVLPEVAGLIAAEQALKKEFDVEQVPLLDQIKAAPDAAALEVLWAEHREVWTDEHTRAAAARKNKLHQQVLRRASAAVSA